MRCEASPRRTAERCYGLARVARVWSVSRASVYRSLKETPPDTIAHRPGPVGACSDSELADHIRQQIAASRLHGEGYRKLWARLRSACWLPCRSSCTAFPCSAAGLTRSGTSSTKSARPTSPSQALTPQGCTPQGHACPQSTCRALGRSSVRRSLRGRATPMRLHACATTSTNCSPASATNPRSNVEGTNPQRHRTTLPRSPATD